MSAERLSDDLVRLTVAASEACRCQQPVRLHDPGCAVNASYRVNAALSRVEQEREAAVSVVETVLSWAGIYDTWDSREQNGSFDFIEAFWECVAISRVAAAAVGREEDA